MVILDSGPLVALLSPADEHHEWAVEIFATLMPPLWTCEAVLVESAYLTGKAVELMKKVSAGVLRGAFPLD
ncbi:MAG: hypothetical protein ACR2OZ_14555 [Verrucomicrobiales bacterium]